jgi:hypothetical protein
LFPKPWFMLDISPVVTPLRLAESDAELIAIKAMVENAIAFLYPSDSSTTAQATQMLDSLSNRSWEIILANLKQSASLTLEILNSLYPWVDLDAAGDGFAATYSDDEALKLIEDYAVTARRIIDMLPIDVSQGRPVAGVLKHFRYLPPCNLVIINGKYYCPTKFFHAWILGPSYHGLRIMPDQHFTPYTIYR